MKKRWVLPEPIPDEIYTALSKFSFLEKVILSQRGILSADEADVFFEGITQDETDPFLLRDMGAAVERIASAIGNQEKIVVYGDYDADGVTATALLLENIAAFGGNIDHYIPNRFREGYGLNNDALEQIKSQNARVIITVDCGIRALSEVEHANNLGLDLIVTDHHSPGPVVPSALAVINPKQDDDNYPFKSLAGVGLAYKLTQALAKHLGMICPRESLDLVAIGTVADMAPLVHENRHLVREGLEIMRQNRRLGIKALCQQAGYSSESLNTTAIGFGIGPRLNAAGRLATAEPALRLMLSTDEEESQELAATLEQCNLERRKIMESTVLTARKLSALEAGVPEFIFVADENFNEGVVGLAASRLVDEYYRPVVVAVKGKAITRASGRSVPEFHITEALERCADMLERFGGHSAAAGFSVANENLDALKTKLSEIAVSQLSGQDLRPSIKIDAVTAFSQLDWNLYEFIERLEPCGEGNPVPCFAANNVKVLGKRQVGKNGAHLKLTLEQGGRAFDAIAFRHGDVLAALPGYVNVAFKLERNDYWNTPSLELNIIDIQPAGDIENNR